MSRLAPGGSAGGGRPVGLDYPSQGQALKAKTEPNDPNPRRSGDCGPVDRATDDRASEGHKKAGRELAARGEPKKQRRGRATPADGSRIGETA